MTINIFQPAGGPSYFKRGAFLPNGNPTQPFSSQNIPGYIYNTESSLFNTISPQFGKPADSGFRFETIFNNVPANVDIYVPISLKNGGNQATLTSDPIGPFNPVAGMNSWVRVPVQQGFGSLTYEVTGNDSTSTGDSFVNLPVVTSFNSGSPTPGLITLEITPQPESPAPPNVEPSTFHTPAFSNSFLNLINQGTENTDAGQIAVASILSCSGTSPIFKLGPPFDTGTPMMFNVLPDGRYRNRQNAVLFSDTNELNNIAFKIRSSSQNTGLVDVPAKASELKGRKLTASSAWLTATLSSTSTPLTVTVEVNPAGMAAGTYNGSVEFTSAVAPTMTLPVVLTVMPPGPALASTALFNAASYAPSAVAPGENVVVYGSMFGPSTLTTAARDAQGRLTTELGGVQLLFDNIPAPLVYAGSGVVSALVPFEVGTKQLTVMQVEYQGVKSAPHVLLVLDAIPGLYTATGGGGGQGAILNQDNSYNNSANPANPGDIIQLFGTGAGQTDPPGMDGGPAQAPFPKPLLPVEVTIDGLLADIVYAASAPGEPEGIFQINARVPLGVARGTGVPVLVTVGTKQTQPGVTVEISPTK